MALMKIRQQDGSWVELPTIVGTDGKTAYQYAVEGGYTGTEEDFKAKLAAEHYTKSEADANITTAIRAAKTYTDQEIAELINGAPTTLDTLGEIATAMAENADVVAALHDAVGSRAAAADLTAHINDKNNPHGVTAEQTGAVPTTRTVNGKALSADITLSASDVGAASATEFTTLRTEFDALAASAVSVLSGAAAPTADLGEDGDIYLVTEG